MGKGRSRRIGNHERELRGPSTVRRRQHSQLPPSKKQKHQTKSTGVVQGSLRNVPFGLLDNVLLVGEGDFSFALSLIENHKPVAVTATCYDSEEELLRKYPDVGGTIKRLQGSGFHVGRGENESHSEAAPFEGFSPGPPSLASPAEEGEAGDLEEQESSGEAKRSNHVLYSIDATKLSSVHKKVLRPSAPFSKIVFNFPHVGGLSTDVNRQVRSNQELIVGFFNSAKALLSTSERPAGALNDLEEVDQLTTKGQILVTIFEGEPYTLWNIRDLARHCGLQIVQSFRFPWSAYPGYKHARTIGDIRTGKDRGDEGRRKGSWRGEEREARCYVIEVREESINNTQGSTRKRRYGSDSSDEK